MNWEFIPQELDNSPVHTLVSSFCGCTKTFLHASYELSHTASMFPALLPSCLLLFLWAYLFPGSMFLNSSFNFLRFSCLRFSSPKCPPTPRKHPACFGCAGSGISSLDAYNPVTEHTCDNISTVYFTQDWQMDFGSLCWVFFLPCEAHWSKPSLGLQFPTWLLDAPLACEWLTRLSSCSVFASVAKQQRKDHVWGQIAESSNILHYCNEVWPSVNVLALDIACTLWHLHHNFFSLFLELRRKYFQL